MIRSREVGLFNAYSFALAGILTICFWGTFLTLQILGVRDLAPNLEAYFAYNLISIGGLMLQLYQTDSSRVNLLALDPLQNLQISTSQTLHVAGALTVVAVLIVSTASVCGPSGTGPPPGGNTVSMSQVANEPPS